MGLLDEQQSSLDMALLGAPPNSGNFPSGVLNFQPTKADNPSGLMSFPQGAQSPSAKSIQPDSIGFFPNQKYVEKNWRPEQFPVDSLNSLANAERLARDNGVLSDKLSRQMLPNALTEGHARFGIVDGRYGYPTSPERDQVLSKLGLKVGPMATTQGTDMDIVSDPKSGYWINRNITDESRQVDISARLAAAILAEKARLYGEDKAIERWNGRGRSIERYENMAIQADAGNHARKVMAMAEMLNHPANASIMDAYKAARGY